MNSKKLNDWLQLIGMAAVVASLIFVGMQIKQSDEIAMVELLDNAAFRNFELSALRASHADVWQKACLGEDLSPPEKAIAADTYFSYLQNNWNSWVRLKTTGYGPAEPSYLTDAVAANLHRYPGLRKIAESYEDWKMNIQFDTAETRVYRDATLARLAELERLEPNAQYDAMWCGHQ